VASPRGRGEAAPGNEPGEAEHCLEGTGAFSANHPSKAPGNVQVGGVFEADAVDLLAADPEYVQLRPIARGNRQAGRKIIHRVTPFPYPSKLSRITRVAWAAIHLGAFDDARQIYLNSRRSRPGPGFICNATSSPMGLVEGKYTTAKTLPPGEIV
jgi:hypothetical protein